MDTVTLSSKLELTKTSADVLRIENTRVSLDSVIIAFNQGATPEQIVQDYDTLSLPQVYAAISHYLYNREEIDSYLAKRKNQNEELRKANDARFGHKGLRERLLTRRGEISK